MPRITMRLEQQAAENMRGVLGLLVDLVVHPEDAQPLSDEVDENLREVDAATLIALSDVSVVLQVLAVQQMTARGGRDAMVQQAVDSGQAVWADASPEA